MTQETAFAGDWLIREYVYTPAGEYVGVIQQHRRLRPCGDLIRVIQLCDPVQPATALSAAAQSVLAVMNRRVGEFVFDLQLVGHGRYYLGPDVAGGGFSWREGVLTGRGLWPRFGYNFTSFSFLLTPARQATGGKFFTANQEIATLVGVGVPEGTGFPELPDHMPWPNAHLARARGAQYTISPEGEWLETITISGHDLPFNQISQAQQRYKQYGALREIEAVAAPGEILSVIEITDAISRRIAGICKWFRDEKLRQVQVYYLEIANASREETR
ncbi:MAG: hypothetical protein HND44_05330 [Chloroflexi bacterium]|nr:hypothetical protein [Ardenticatenaceae bacterium]MBL1127915.1 hypothetical protein [Chloroflexota bacterium]NOG33985.1 hypothetical protein [Chloroflexota bacterium]GIK55671.1 MAG: hypothetical protein BroJett015_13340 [Chloroflexota bacterium]